MSMTREQFEANKRKKHRRKVYRRRALVIVAVLLILTFIIWGVAKLVKAFATKPEEPKGEVMTLDQFDTPTPTPTPVPIEGLNRRDPKPNHRLILVIESSYEDIPEAYVRANPWKKAAKIGAISIGDKFEISCVYTDPNNRGYYGFYGSELGIGGGIVWIYTLYCDVDDVIEPWAVHTIEPEYSKKYDRSRVTIKSSDGNADANVRSEPWESDYSSYGRIRVNATFTADVVYVTSDKQWYGFPSAALYKEIDNVERDPDEIIWIYAAYCIIDPK